MKKLFVITALLLSTLNAQAQQQERIDSLWKIVPTLSESDTHIVFVLSKLAWDVSYQDLDSGLTLVRRAIAIAHEQGNVKSESYSQNVAGTIYADLGLYPEAISAHLRSIKIKDSLGAPPDEMGGSYHNLGLVYESMDSIEVCLRYQRKAYEYYHLSSDSTGVAPIAHYLGRHYIEVDSIDKAMEYFVEGRRVAEYYNFKHWLAANMAGIAYCHVYQGNNAQADTLIKQAFAIARSEDNPYDMMAIWIAYSDVLKLKKKYQEAIIAIDSALAIATNLNVRDSKMNQLRMLAELYELDGDNERALLYYQQYQILKDDILSIKNQQNIKNLEAVYEKDKTEKELAIAKEADRQQKIYVAGGIVSSVGFIVIAILLFGRIKMGKKAGLVLEQQKAIIESKNKDITDSINYARRIQEAVSPIENQLRSIFPKSFVFNRPRSIVSGDFWWTAETKDHYFIALGDCSGHGVPGGFMSVMAASFLNGIVIENNVNAPDQILFELNQKIRAALQHEGNSENNPLVSDTIEIAVCRFNKQKTEMHFSSAGMPVVLVRKNQVIEYRGAEQRAGAVSGMTNPFTPNKTELQKSDRIYLLSDGLNALPGSDQRNVYDMLATLRSSQEIDEYLRVHCGNTEQPDDILILGAEI